MADQFHRTESMAQICRMEQSIRCEVRWRGTILIFIQHRHAHVAANQRGVGRVFQCQAEGFVTFRRSILIDLNLDHLAGFAGGKGPSKWLDFKIAVGS